MAILTNSRCYITVTIVLLPVTIVLPPVTIVLLPATWAVAAADKKGAMAVGCKHFDYPMAATSS